MDSTNKYVLYVTDSQMMQLFLDDWLNKSVNIVYITIYYTGKYLYMYYVIYRQVYIYRYITN